MHRQLLQVMIKPDCEMIIFIRIVELMCFSMWLLYCSSRVSRNFETRKIFWASWTDLKSCSRDSTTQLINILTANTTRCDLDTIYILYDERNVYIRFDIFDDISEAVISVWLMMKERIGWKLSLNLRVLRLNAALKFHLKLCVLLLSDERERRSIQNIYDVWSQSALTRINDRHLTWDWVWHLKT